MRAALPRSFYIPAGSTEIADADSSAVAYVYVDSRGRPAVALFAAKQAKPVKHWLCRSEAEREKAIADFFDGQRARKAMVDAIRAERQAAPNLFAVGDVLASSWGYEQTNVNFYEVVAVSGRMLTLREIASKREDRGHYTGLAFPMVGEYVGDPMRRQANGGSVRIDNCQRAHRAEYTEIVAGVRIYKGQFFSTYA